MNKYDQFWAANKKVEQWNARGDRATMTLTEEVNSTFGEWGEFHIDNADIILLASKLESVAPELIAVTWMNETTFRFYSEPNKNNAPNDFTKWDVGPMQLNVGYTQKDLAVDFFRGTGLDMPRVFGSPLGAGMFNGDPVENIKLGARKLKALGRAGVVGKDSVILMPKVTVDAWKVLDDHTKNLRRAALYTRPDARNSRIDSFNKFAPLFRTFFKNYDAQ